METLAFIRSLIGMMHAVIAMRMHPLTGETDMSDARVRSLVADTFTMIREAHAAIIAASVEADDVKTKREAAHKAAAGKFAAALEKALNTPKIPEWAIHYRDMMATAKPAGGDRETAAEIQSLHDAQRKMIAEAFAVTNPCLADAETWIPRLGTKGRPVGSRNKSTDDKSADATEVSEVSETSAETSA